MKMTTRAFTAAAIGLALGALAGPTAALAQQKEWKEIRIGTEGAYPPFNNLNAQKQLEGFEIDYFNALCEKMKVKCTWVVQDWDGIIPALLANKYDVIVAGMNATDERRKRVDFTATYTKIPPAMIAAKTYSGATTPDALKGKAVATQGSTIHANYLEQYYKGSDIKLFPTQEEANLALSQGRVDFVVADKLALQDFVEGKGKDCCKFVADLQRDPKIHGDGVGVAVRKEDTALKDLLSKAIEESLKDGTHEKARAKWFKVPIM
ncbi:MAG: transporter substrate-binding domain-containing protein [Beijerinckiaceae bacterium]